MILILVWDRRKSTGMSNENHSYPGSIGPKKNPPIKLIGGWGDESEKRGISRDHFRFDIDDFHDFKDIIKSRARIFFDFPRIG